MPICTVEGIVSVGPLDARPALSGQRAQERASCPCQCTV